MNNLAVLHTDVSEPKHPVIDPRFTAALLLIQDRFPEWTIEITGYEEPTAWVPFPSCDLVIYQKGIHYFCTMDLDVVLENTELCMNPVYVFNGAAFGCQDTSNWSPVTHINGSMRLRS